MLNKLISLVFLLSILIINNAYSENDFIFPVKKPSIFKKLDSKTDAKNIELPQKKPVISSSVPNTSTSQEKKKKFFELKSIISIAPGGA